MKSYFGWSNEVLKTMQKITPKNAEEESNHTIAAAYTMHTISETNKDNVNFLWV